MLDWLKTIVWEKPPAPERARPDPGRSRVWIDKRVYPILSVDRNGLVADRYDGTLMAEGHRLQVKVHVDDLYGSFRFDSLVTVTRVAGPMFSGVWWMMLPEHRQQLDDYDRAKRTALLKASRTP